MATPSRSSGNNRSQQRQARIGDGLLAAPSHRQQVDAEDEGHRQQGQEPKGPGEAHTTRLNHMMESSPPATNSSAAPMAKRAVTSMCWATILNRRSMPRATDASPAASDAARYVPL